MMPLTRLIACLLTMRLRVVVALGLALALLALPAGLLALARPSLVSGTGVALLFMGGIQLAALGVIVDYLAFTLPQTRRALEH